MATTDEDLRSAVSELAEGFRDVRQAILGDERLGHDGLVKRTRLLEQLAQGAPEIHQGIEDRSRDSVKRTHERIDELEKAQRTRTESLEEALTDSLRAVEKKVDRMIWMAAGAGASGLLAGAGGAWAIIQASGTG